MHYEQTFHIAWIYGTDCYLVSSARTCLYKFDIFVPCSLLATDENSIYSLVGYFFFALSRSRQNSKSRRDPFRFFSS